MRKQTSWNHVATLTGIFALAIMLAGADARGEAIDPVKEPAKAVKALIAVIHDPKSTADQRTVAVDTLGHMLGVTGRMIPTTSRVEAGVATLGLSEVILIFVPRENLVPRDQLPEVGDLLVELLSDPSESVRTTAANVIQASLGWIHPTLYKACSDKSATRLVALPQLGRLLIQEIFFHPTPMPETIESVTKGLSYLERAAQDEKPDVRRVGTDALASVRTAFTEWADTVARSRSLSDFEVRHDLINSVGFGPALKDAIPKFRARLSDPDFDIRLAAARLVACLEGPSEKGRQALAATLWNNFHFNGTLDKSERSALYHLVEELKTERRVGTFDWWTVKHLGPKAAPAVPFIATGLPTISPFELPNHLESLSWIGPAGAPVAPALVPLLQSSDERVRLMAAVALAHVAADPRAVPVLKRGLTAFFPPDRRSAAYALLLIDPHDRDALQQLVFPPQDYQGPLLTLLTAEAIRVKPIDTERMCLAIKVLLLREELAAREKK